MKKFEYKIVTEGFREKKLEEFLNEQGQEGWELAYFEILRDKLIGQEYYLVLKKEV